METIAVDPLWDVPIEIKNVEPRKKVYVVWAWEGKWLLRGYVTLPDGIMEDFLASKAKG